ncbi:hypothetical protein H072_10606 [Dactylellina haptotyla CBS 200.50]|uniref:Uncharacterized protein n=1 Tax=Dactylellina haptotyla (strain CBS 200.50) TaxID=1284197 RepID=S8BL03_DACHA|nr:hypothetical protein H072_10606 [Dactylellina haptotyla CBS 200.50]
MRKIFLCTVTLSQIFGCQAYWILDLVWGWHNQTVGQDKEGRTTWTNPSKAELHHTQGGGQKYACHSQKKIALNYDEFCMGYSAELCWFVHTEWTNSFLHDVANYVWIYEPGDDKNLGLGDPVKLQWPPTFDYTFEFFTDPHCLTPMLDSKKSPIKFTVDTVRDHAKCLKVAEYIQDCRMPITGFFRGSRKAKEEVAHYPHHSMVCTDPAHCTPPPERNLAYRLEDGNVTVHVQDKPGANRS